METPELPQREMDATPKVLAAFRTQGIEIEGSEWKYVPELDRWHLYLKTSWVEKHGEETILRAQNDALLNAGIDEDIAARVRLEREWVKA